MTFDVLWLKQAIITPITKSMFGPQPADVFEKRRTSENGWGLIDILIAITIVGIVVVPLLLLAGQNIKGSSEAVHRTQAVYYAQQKLEELKQNDGVSLPTAQATTPIAGTIYSYAIQAVTPQPASIPTSLQANLQAFQVTVSWQEKGQTRAVTLSSYYYK